MLFHNHEPSTKPKRRTWLTPHVLGIGFMIVALWLILFFSAGSRDSSQPSIARFFMVPVSTAHKVHQTITNVRQFFVGNFTAKRELDLARREINLLREDNQQLRYKYRQFDMLRDYFNLPEDEEIPAVRAIVSAIDDRMGFSLIIDRGTDDGLKPNMPVLTLQDQMGLVGRTTKDLRHHAMRIMPLSDTRSAVGVFVEGTSFKGILRGRGIDIELHLTNLDQVDYGSNDALPQPGQLVVTSGESLIFPRSLIAGTISDTTFANGYLVKPSVDFRAVRAVQVIINTTLKNDVLSLLKEEQQ